MVLVNSALRSTYCGAGAGRSRYFRVGAGAGFKVRLWLHLDKIDRLRNTGYAEGLKFERFMLC